LYEVEVNGEGLVGFGNVGYDPIRPSIAANIGEVRKRVEIVTEKSSSNFSELSSPSAEDCFDVPDMGIKICISFFGQSIPAYELKGLFTGVFANIQASFDRHPEERIPGNIFQYTEIFKASGNRIFLVIQGDPRATIVWLGLAQMVSGLWMYMKGTHPHMPSQQQHFQALRFNLITFGKVQMGSGYIWCTPEVGSIAIS